MKFDFHLKSGKTVTIDFPNAYDIDDVMDMGLIGSFRVSRHGAVNVDAIEAITEYTEPAAKPTWPRILIDDEGDTWIEVAPDRWKCVSTTSIGFDSYTLDKIKNEFGPLQQDPRCLLDE